MTDKNGWPLEVPLFLTRRAAIGLCSRCGRSGGCNCAAAAPTAPRLYTEAEVAARVAEAVQAEREACAAVAEARMEYEGHGLASLQSLDYVYEFSRNRERTQIAAAIRARGNKP